MDYGDKAVEYFSQGYNCAQSTAAAFAADFGLDAQIALDMMAGFGGGIAGTREMCGAVSGMVLAISLKKGSYDPQDNAAKTKFYAEVRAAIKEFTDKYQTTCCKELLLKAGCVPKVDPSARNAGYYAKRPCAHFVAEAARIAQAAIERN
jgi:C_GCAxxG_C_C family probable redox protein